MVKQAPTKLAIMVLSFSLLTPLLAYAQSKSSDVVIVNNSNREVHHLYVSPSDDDAWGPDQLDPDVLARKDSLTLKNIPCDEYDFKIVDKKGAICVIEAVFVCKIRGQLSITEKMLAGC
jgi:hypothetical protein